jgi:hypothetical protein
MVIKPSVFWHLCMTGFLVICNSVRQTSRQSPVY